MKIRPNLALIISFATTTLALPTFRPPASLPTSALINSHLTQILAVSSRIESTADNNDTNLTFPPACSASCADLIQVQTACNAHDLDGCLEVCSAQGWAQFTSCVQCDLKVEPMMTTSSYNRLRSSVNLLYLLCSLNTTTQVPYFTLPPRLNSTVPTSATILSSTLATGTLLASTTTTTQPRLMTPSNLVDPPIINTSQPWATPDRATKDHSPSTSAEMASSSVSTASSSSASSSKTFSITSSTTPPSMSSTSLTSGAHGRFDCSLAFMILAAAAAPGQQALVMAVAVGMGYLSTLTL